MLSLLYLFTNLCIQSVFLSLIYPAISGFTGDRPFYFVATNVVVVSCLFYVRFPMHCSNEIKLEILKKE